MAGAKKLIWSFVAIATLALLFAVVLLPKHEPGKAPAVSSQPAPKYNIVNVTSTARPQGLPQSISFSGEESVVKNFTAGAGTQSTRQFTSSKTVAQNFDFYKQYMSDPAHGWTPVSSDDTNASHAYLFARGGQGILGINISSVNGSAGSVVDVSFTKI